MSFSSSTGSWQTYRSKQTHKTRNLCEKIMGSVSAFQLELPPGTIVVLETPPHCTLCPLEASLPLHMESSMKANTTPKVEPASTARVDSARNPSLSTRRHPSLCQQTDTVLKHIHIKPSHWQLVLYSQPVHKHTNNGCYHIARWVERPLAIWLQYVLRLYLHRTDTGTTNNG